MTHHESFYLVYSTSYIDGKQHEYSKIYQGAEYGVTLYRLDY